MKEAVIILIPAYNPEKELVEIVKELQPTKIIVVNDGSENKQYFEKIKPYCEIISNEKNMGKGVALKKGFSYIIEKYPNIHGVVTVDADGQHLVKDIKNVKQVLEKTENKIVLGTRNFREKQVPIINKIGNIFINYVFDRKTKVKIRDTQTGLRGIPTKYLNEIIKIPGERYEYEINQLKFLAENVEIVQVKIATVYSKKIKSSFKRIKDSIKVLKAIIK